MAEDELSPDLAEAVRALKAARGSCPSESALVAYHALPARARASDPVHDHVQVCSRCQVVLLHLDQEPAEVSRRQRWWMIAAVVALAVAGGLISRSRPASEPVEVIRGTELQPVAPAGRVVALERFEWQSPIRAASYRVRVYRGNTLLWTGTSPHTSLPVSGALPLEREVEYTWVIEALDATGDVRLSSAPQMFVLGR